MGGSDGGSSQFVRIINRRPGQVEAARGNPCPGGRGCVRSHGADEGRRPGLKFTAGSLTLSGGVTATVSQGSATTTTSSPALDFSGSVVLYATQLSGCAASLCVTLTPANVVTVLLKLIGPVTSHVSLTLTSVTTDQPLVLAGSLQASGLSISVG